MVRSFGGCLLCVRVPLMFSVCVCLFASDVWFRVGSQGVALASDAPECTCDIVWWVWSASPKQARTDVKFVWTSLNQARVDVVYWWIC